MALPRRIQFVPNQLENRVTHFLCIPLLDSASRPRFRASIQPLLRHPALANVPTTAFRPPGVVHLPLEAFDLATREQFTAFTGFLERLDIVDILEAAAICCKNGVKFNAQKYWSERTPLKRPFSNRRSAMRASTPLVVLISGLRCKEGKEAATDSLSVYVIDPTYRLVPLYDSLRVALHSAGFLRHTTGRDGLRMREQAKRQAASKHAVKILRMFPKRGEIVPCVHLPGLYRSRDAPRFDARGALAKFQNHSWLENVRLGKISLCRRGLTKKLSEGAGGIDSDMELAEDFSIPLP